MIRVSVRLREIEQAAKTFDVVVHLLELIVQGRVGDRGEMKNRVELFVAELPLPIERGQILRDEIAVVTGQVLEITGAKIVDHGQPRLGHPSCKASRGWSR